MDNENTTPVAQTKDSKNTTLIIIIIVIILLILVGGFVYYKSRKNATLSTSVTPSPTITISPTAIPSVATTNPSMTTQSGMTAVTSPPLTAAQKAQIAAGTSTTTTKKAFTIVGGNFYFAPNNIKVNKNDTVTVTFSNAGGTHNFFLDELSVKTPTIKAGDSSTVTFIADKAGTFAFYCSIGTHRALGMKGTLTVQ